jgi:thiol-disulfide isomerase/thioredoxin
LASAVAACALLAGCGTAATAGSPVRTTGPTSSSDQSVGVTVYPEGQRTTIPDVSGPTLDGRTWALSGQRGHVVVLNVWASWCEPCRSESPVLAGVARSTASAGVRFVGIDEQDRLDAARAFAASAGATYPHVVDADGTLLRSLRLVPSSGIPSTLVLDASGHVAARVIGAVDAATFEDLVRSVAAGGPSTGTS